MDTHIYCGTLDMCTRCFWSPVTGVCRVAPVCGSLHVCVFSQEQPIVPAGSDERAINSTNLLRLCQQHFIKTLCVRSC